MTEQELQTIKERSNSLLDGGITMFREDIETNVKLVAEIEQLRKLLKHTRGMFEIEKEECAALHEKLEAEGRQKEGMLREIERLKKHTSALYEENQQLQNELEENRLQVRCAGDAVAKVKNNEIQQLRAALQRIVQVCDQSDQIRMNNDLMCCEDIALEVLGGDNK